LIKNLVDVAQKCPSDKVAIKLTFTLKPTNKKKKTEKGSRLLSHIQRTRKTN